MSMVVVETEVNKAGKGLNRSGQAFLMQPHPFNYLIFKTKVLSK